MLAKRNGSFGVKVVVIACLAVLFQIPMAFIGDLLHEREMRRNTAIDEVSASVGGRVKFGGPLLQLPYSVVSRCDGCPGGERLREAVRYLVPDSLRIEGESVVETRYRGIFPVPIFRTELQISGKFSTGELVGDLAQMGDVRFIHWDRVQILFGVPLLSSVQEAVRVAIAGKDLSLEPSSEEQEGPLGKVFRSDLLELQRGATEAFSMKVALRGSNSLTFVPVSNDMHVRLTSNWPDPSFQGALLPTARSITSKGFEAEWNVPRYRAAIPRVLSTLSFPVHDDEVALPAEFGVIFCQAVDGYRMTERATKYNLLFIGLVFLAFFLTEVTLNFAIHPLQYGMVGAALVLFYLLLLSFSEHVGFSSSYALSAAIAFGMLTGYFKAVYRGQRGWPWVAALLGGLYGFLYAVLLEEDYALVAGSLGLVAALSVTMYLTRRIDWYAAERPLPPKE